MTYKSKFGTGPQIDAALTKASAAIRYVRQSDVSGWPDRPDGEGPVFWFGWTEPSGLGPLDMWIEIPEADGSEDTVPVITNAGTISGTPIVGNTLSVTGFKATGSPTPTLTYQWQRDTGSGFSAISGATSATYTLVEADQGHDVRRQTTATNSGDSVKDQTAAVSVSAEAEPSIGRASWLDSEATDFKGLETMRESPDGTGDPVAVGDFVGWAEAIVGSNAVQTDGNRRPTITGTENAYNVTFDGGDVLLAPAPPALAGSDEITFSMKCLFNARSTSSVASLLIVAPPGGSTSDGGGLRIQNGALLRFTQFGSSGGLVLEGEDFESFLPLNEWLSIVAVVRSGGGTEIWVNGVLAASGTSGTTVPEDLTGWLVNICGREGQSTGTPGNLSEVQLYDRALSEAEIIALAGDTRLNPNDLPSGLVGYWPL